jgi:hypothetical protein
MATEEDCMSGSLVICTDQQIIFGRLNKDGINSHAARVQDRRGTYKIWVRSSDGK